MFEAKIVTGGQWPNTEYDEENVLRAPSFKEVIHEVLKTTPRQTWDIIDPDGQRVARTYPDGGIDHMALTA